MRRNFSLVLMALAVTMACGAGLAHAADPDIEARPEPAAGVVRQGPPAEVVAAAKTYWDRVLARCDGDAFHYFERSEIIDYKAPINFSVQVQPLTDADHEAGYGWKARATLTAAGWRSRGADDNLHTRGDWSPFVGDADESVDLSFYKGKVLFNGAELPMVRKAISCAQILGPTGEDFMRGR